MRVIAALAAVVGAQFVSASASASGSYKCCLIDKAGYRYVYQSRASSRYQGTMDALCVSAARNEKARRCDARSFISIGFDFVRGRWNFGPDEQPEHVNLFAQCNPAGCSIGVTMKGVSKVNVIPQNAAKCRLTSFPAPKVPPATAAYTLHLTLTAGKANACVLDIDGKSTTFYSDIKDGD